jgi:exodeoxyribonuclease V beta subunit
VAPLIFATGQDKPLSVPSLPVFHPIDDLDAVDLSRHALVEASAGTGKTYTIENLVVRLLKESSDLGLENILLVTFTEKATSEIKLRIRQKIEQTLDGDHRLTHAVRKKLTDALDGFDNAPIFTIHGFCHTLLKEFPFETGNLFEQEVIDDGPLLEKLLKAQMRTDWPRRYGRRLEVLLALAGFSATADGFVQTAVNLVQRLSGDPAYETLIPDPAQLDVDDLWQATEQTVLALKTLVGTPPRFSNAYGRLNINTRTRAAIIRDMVEPIEQALEKVDIGACRIAAFKPVATALDALHSSGGRNIDRLVPQKWLKAGENLHECPDLVAIKDRLEALVGLFTRLSHVLMLASVGQLRQDVRAMKSRNGWISYQDMLTRVADFLAATGADPGIRKIRNRYRVAFVDEFQDTDEIQWRIFKTLFLHDGQGSAGNRLFLIGDPKQAIYAFRGADVFTYLRARQRIKSLAGEGLANLYHLTVNWRSTPDLVDTFNRIFSREAWFGNPEQPSPFEIGYTPSDSPDADQPTPALGCDGSQRPPFNVMDLSAATRHTAAKALLAGFICREIGYLVGQGKIRMTGSDGLDRALHFGDIAILVRSQSEFVLIEPLLNESSIPYAYYRKPGLFQCREAHWLSMVLRAVCHPQQAATVKLALLTPFFDVSPVSLAFGQELPADHSSQVLLARWHDNAHRRRWGPLFQSLVEDSGLALRHCIDPGWERTATNFQQLFDYLELSATTRNLSIGGLVALLDSLRLSDIAAGSDADIHQIEGEGDKVQILTMHVSKGLQFPVVFIAGGLTVRSTRGMHVYHTMDPDHPEQGCRKVIDLTGGSGKAQAEKETDDENKRLYYVALTRAQYKLYVPYYPDSSNHSWRGPISRFVSPSIGQALLNTGDSTLRGGWHAIGEQVIGATEPLFARSHGGEGAIGLPGGRLLPPQADFRSRKVSLESFSSISHRISQSLDLHGLSTPFRLIDAIRREDDEPALAALPESMEPDRSDGLPGGTQVGSMFHHVFEHIDFQAVMDGPADIQAEDRLRLVIESAMALYRVDPRWMPQIARMVATALRVPIDADGQPLVLGRLTPAQRRHELEFFFPLGEPLPAPLRVPGCTLSGDPCRERVIRGFIDLMFSWQGRYYIADWKSNLLTEGYHQAAMARVMASAGYELQYRLYTIATLRWLQRQLGDRFDPQRQFGGVFYFFIRGIGSGGRDGIFHVTPEQLLPLESTMENIYRQIADLPW